MAKISINKLNLPKDSTETKIMLNGAEVIVKNFIDTSDKSTMIDRAIGSATEAYGVDEVIADAVLHYWILLKQTNISIKEEISVADAVKIVDQFTKAGFLGQILDCISKEDYDQLLESCANQIAKADSFIQSTGLAINRFSEDLSRLLILALEKTGKIDPLPRADG